MAKPFVIKAKRLLACSAALVILASCGSDSGVGAPVEEDVRRAMDAAIDLPEDSAPQDVEAVDTARLDSAAPQDTRTPDTSEPDTSEPDTPQDTTTQVDAFLEDAFDRPDLASPDVAEDTEPLDAAEPDTMEVDVAEPDVGPGPQQVEGEFECLRHTLEVRGDTFVWGEDLLVMIWDVRNACSRPWRMRLEQEEDFLSIVLYKDGVPWVAYPDCFGRGDPYETVFEGGGNGLRRGWLWIGADHASWVERCAAEPFDPSAQYSVVGYGATEVAATDEAWSEVFPMSEPIPITLTLP